MNRNKLIGLLSLIGTAFVGGAILPSVIRLGTSLMHPFLLNFFRAFISLPILLLLFRGRYRLKLILDRKHLLVSFVLALGLVLNTTMFSFAVAHTTLIASQLIYVFTPIATSLIAYFVLREKIGSKKIIGMIMAFLGVLLLIVFSRSPAEKLSLGTFYGNSLIFIGMFGYSTYMVFSKKLSVTFSIIEMVILTGIFTSAILLLMGAWAIYQEGLIQINLQSITVVILLALSSITFMLLNQTTIKHLSASNASLSSLLSPEFAALAGIFIYNEKLSIILLVSMFLSVVGTFISVSAEKTTFLDRMKLAIEKLKTIKRIS